MRYLALGDSYTIGEGAAEDERWPVQLSRLLCAEGLALDPPEVIARTGWTTSELAAGIQDAALAGPYDLVSLLIGVNNQYRGLPLDAYTVEFSELFQGAIAFAGGTAERVLVLSIPDWGVSPFAEGRNRTAIAAEIDAFNAVNREEAGCSGARYVDVTSISRTYPNAVAPDGLHPSGEMYALWAAAALPAARAALGG